MEKNESLKEKLKELDDTYHGINFAETINLFIKDGYELIYNEEFIAKEFRNGKERKEHYHIYWKDGILVTVESYNTTGLNTGKAYFNFEHTENGPYVLHDCSHGGIVKGIVDGKPVWSNVREVSLDIREGYFTNMERIQNGGTIFQRWIEPPFLWFLNYIETKDKDYNYSKINYAKVQKFPLHVIEGMFGTIDHMHNYFDKRLQKS